MPLKPQKSAGVSSRRLTMESGRFIRRTPGSQSLERGLSILRAFRSGVSVLANAELAERVCLPRPTVSRLTRSLVDSGFLAFDLRSQGYRPTAVFLSIARVFRDDVPALDIALPLMKKVAEGESINVGLAVADQTEMVYLESVRESRRGIFRRLVPGSRTPMELTSLGRAYLYALDKTARRQVLKSIAARYSGAWSNVKTQIAQSFHSLDSEGYCVAAWQPGMVSIAAPLLAPDRTLYALNISFPSAAGENAEIQTVRYAPMLLNLARDIRAAWQERQTEFLASTR